MSATGDPEGPPSPWASTRTQLATGFVLLLIVVGIVIAIFHHNGGHKHTAVASRPQTSTSTAPATSTTTTSTPTAVGGCSLPAGNQNIPSTSPPSGVTWETIGTMATPEATSTLGPQHVVDGVETCFARSPSGALLAAMNVYPEFTTSVPEKTLFDEFAVDVPKTVKLSSVPINSDGNATNAEGVQIAGYKFDSYTSSKAQINVVLQFPKGLVAVNITLAWEGGTWKYVFPPSGPSTEPLNTSTLSPPYVSWSQF